MLFLNVASFFATVKNKHDASDERSNSMADRTFLVSAAKDWLEEFADVFANYMIKE